MKHHIEAGAAAPGQPPRYRWSCSACSQAGNWRESLNEAERAAYSHEREKHGQAVSA